MIRRATKKSKKTEERPPEFSGMLRYKKLNGGIHKHPNGQIVKKGEILYAHPGELSELFLPGWECLDEVKKASEGVTLGIKDRGNGWYDVVNKKTGEKLNEEAMRAKTARKFITGDIEENLISVVDGNEDEEDIPTSYDDLRDMDEEGLLEFADENSLSIDSDDWKTEEELRNVIAEMLKIEL